MILGGLKNTVVTLVMKGQVPKDIAGPVGIFQITGEATKNGALAVLQFLGILSVNLAIINVLPLPALDGGRLIFLGYEAVTKKKANPKVESWVNTAGMAFLLALMLLITVNDILRLVRR
jgi:regulator of sigma E protease